MDERLWAVLCEGVERYLAGVDRVLGGPEPGLGGSAPWALVRERLRPLVAAWRAVLAEHRTGPTGRCRHCDRVRLGRRRSCSVWRTAHAHFVAAVPPG